MTPAPPTRPGVAGPGLTTAEAQERQRRHGRNALPPPPGDPLWRRLLRQFRSPLILILLAALLLDVGLWALEGHRGSPLEAIAIALILLLNAGLGMWQERKAERAIARLDELATPRVWVFRDGQVVLLAAADLVPGDLVRLENGDRVPADGVAVGAENLQLDESVLTGESLPVERWPGAELAAGTLVVRGRVTLEVIRIGAGSAMGRLATLLGSVRQEVTPLERRLRAFGRRAALGVLLLATLITVGGAWLEGLGSLGQVLLFAVALAVAVVPEGLPAILTVTLALGVERMARRRAVVRKLAAVEALGSVTVIATDKTGTITENRMRVEEVESHDPQRALRAMVLANDAVSEADGTDPLEAALLAHARQHGIDLADLRATHPRRHSRPFDAAARYMRVTVTEGTGAASYLKGAPEVLLERCTLPPDRLSHWTERLQAAGAEGYRTLGLAWAPGEHETGLTWLGLVLLWDPPREDVPSAIARAREAGIRVLMITGDHASTALTMARHIGLPAPRVAVGADLEGVDADGLRRLVRDTTVFARTTPGDKLRIVEALQAGGEIVAMTGDGVNDAPALKRADVGVAMGRRGSALSREVADVVLLDDAFGTIVAAVEEGRSIYENVQKFIRFLLSTNLSEVLVVGLGCFAAILLDLRGADGRLLLPLTAAQLLWINLVTDGAPALALGLVRNPGVMRGPPRDPAAPLLDRPSLRFVVLAGGGKAILAFALLGGLPLAGVSVAATQSATFLFMVLGQVLLAYPSRSVAPPSPRNAALHWAVAISFLVQAAVVALPVLRNALHVIPPAGLEFALVAAAVGLAWGSAELVARRIRNLPGGRGSR